MFPRVGAGPLTVESRLVHTLCYASTQEVTIATGLKPASWAYAEEFVSEDDVLATARRHGRRINHVHCKDIRADVLDRLKAEEREALLSRGSVRLPSDVDASGRAAAAVSYAMAQVGKAYVYGAAGPSAFDCSGLTMMAWAQAGVGLPHSSSAQSGTGTRVSADQLQPGDLVFYYSPISHVGMYIGNGQMVHAPNTGSVVNVTSVNFGKAVGFARPG